MDFQIYEIQPVGRGRTSDICITTPLKNFYDDWIKHPSVSNIKVSLPFRRLKELDDYMPDLSKIGVTANNVRDAVSINIGVDGSVRICPWDVTSEPIMFVTKDNFEILFDVIESQQTHRCEYCTRIILRKVRNAKTHV